MPVPHRTLRSLVALLGVLLIGACGNGSPTGTSPGATTQGGDPNAISCTLLTQAEVEAVLSQTLTLPTGNDGEPSTCHYANAGGFGLTVEVSHSPTALADLAKDKSSFGSRASDLPGVGEAAFEVTGQRIIEFVKGNTIVNLYTEEGIVVVTEDKFHGLATTAASRVK